MELLRLRLGQALGPERAAQLLPPYPEDGINILSTDAFQVAADELLRLDRSLQLNFGLGGREIGSNNWVVAGSRTATGMPMLADDPHLSASIPSIWYLAELQGDQIHAIGATFPGMPAIVIGHNERVAWGVTNVGPDTQDLYVERINPANPNQYEVNGTWEDMAVFEEQIVVAGEDQPLRWAARATRHGPLISDVATTSTPLALRWMALEPGDTTMDAFMGLNYAANWEEFVDALRLYVSPSQNFVYADVDGNIGYYAPGRIPIRAEGHNGMLPVPGWDSSAEWQGHIPFDRLPHTLNPPEGFVATANNRVVGEDYPYLLSNDWAPPYRAQRITQLIEEFSEGDKISLDDMAAIQGDRKSLQTPELLPFLLSVDPSGERQAQAIAYLRGWNGEMAPDSVAAAIYQAWMLHMERALFEDDLRGDLFEDMAARANPLFLSNVLSDEALSSAWCDNVLSIGQESCEQAALSALDSALQDLATRAGDNMAQWRWDKIHVTQYPHSPFSEVAYLKPLFHRSIGNGGDRYTVNVAPVNLETPYDQTHVPGYRHLVDLADLQASRFVQTTGQSGNVLSNHYDDLVRLHRDVQYLPMAFGRTAVEGDSLTLEP
jgi:penicillin amidase